MAKNKVGCPTKYKNEYSAQVERLCKLGLIDEELATFFEIDIATFYRWKNAHKEFREAIKRGKTECDVIVAEKLFHRATGYEHEDVDIKMYEGSIIKTKLIKHYPPDTTAAIFWLKNRQPKQWRDKQEVEHSGDLKLDVSQTKFSIKAKGK